MASHYFVVALRDIEDGPKNVRFELGDAFLDSVFDGTDAKWNSPGELDIEVTKTGRQVMVRGRAALSVTVPCARTLEPVHLHLSPDIFLMLSQASGDGSVRRERGKKRRGKAPADRGKKKAGQAPDGGGKKASAAGTRKYRGWEDDPELSEGDAANDTFSGEEIVLDTFVREFLLLELPMNAVSSDLPTEENAAIPRPPAEKGDKPIDPRLAPLAAIAARLRKDE